MMLIRPGEIHVLTIFTLSLCFFAIFSSALLPSARLQLSPVDITLLRFALLCHLKQEAAQLAKLREQLATSQKEKEELAKKVKDLESKSS